MICTIVRFLGPSPFFPPRLFELRFQYHPIFFSHPRIFPPFLSAIVQIFLSLRVVCPCSTTPIPTPSKLATTPSLLSLLPPPVHPNRSDGYTSRRLFLHPAPFFGLLLWPPTMACSPLPLITQRNALFPFAVSVTRIVSDGGFPEVICLSPIIPPSPLFRQTLSCFSRRFPLLAAFPSNLLLFVPPVPFLLLIFPF